MAWFECEPFATYEGGDHLIFVGKVVALQVRESTNQRPLAFFRGRYRQIAAETTDSAPTYDSLLLHGW